MGTSEGAVAAVEQLDDAIREADRRHWDVLIQRADVGEVEVGRVGEAAGIESDHLHGADRIGEPGAREVELGDDVRCRLPEEREVGGFVE